MAHDVGVSTIRVATHSTEADVSEQHITAARKLGMDTVGFLMMAHMASPEKLLEEAQKMVSYGANCIYVTDSAGYMLPQDVTDRVGILRANTWLQISKLVSMVTITWAWALRTLYRLLTAGATRVDLASAGLRCRCR